MGDDWDADKAVAHGLSRATAEQIARTEALARVADRIREDARTLAGYAVRGTPAPPPLPLRPTLPTRDPEEDYAALVSTWVTEQVRQYGRAVEARERQWAMVLWGVHL